MSREASQHIDEIGVGIASVLLGGSDEAHDGSGAFAGGARSGKQPILAADGDRSDGAFNGIVVDGQTTVVDIAHQRDRLTGSG